MSDERIDGFERCSIVHACARLAASGTSGRRYDPVRFMRGLQLSRFQHQEPQFALVFEGWCLLYIQIRRAYYAD